MEREYSKQYLPSTTATGFRSLSTINSAISCLNVAALGIGMEAGRTAMCIILRALDVRGACRERTSHGPQIIFLHS